MGIRIPSASEMGLGQRLPEGVSQPVKKVLPKFVDLPAYVEPKYVEPSLAESPNLDKITMAGEQPLLMGQTISKGIGDLARTGMNISLSDIAYQERNQIVEKLKQEKSLQKAEFSTAKVDLLKIKGYISEKTNKILADETLDPQGQMKAMKDAYTEIKGKYKTIIPPNLQPDFNDDLEAHFINENTKFMVAQDRKAKDKTEAATAQSLGLLETQAANGQISIDNARMEAAKVLISDPRDEVQKVAAAKTFISSIYKNDVLNRVNNKDYLNLLVDLKAQKEDKSFIKYQGMDPTERETYISDVQAAIEKNTKTTEDQIKEAREQTGISFAQKRAEGTLTKADILKSNLPGTGGNSINDWLNLLEEDRAKIKKGEEVVIKTNPVVEATWYEKIDNADDPSKITNSEIRKDIFAGNLSPDDANKIITYRDKLINGDDPLKSEAVKIARVQLNDAKSKKLFNSDDPVKNMADWGKFNSYLTRYVENNPKATPEEISGFVDTILEPVKQGFIDNLIDTFAPGTPRLDANERKQNAQIETLAGPAKIKTGIDIYKEKQKAKGIIEKGNIDLNNRPIVKNPDGSISTVLSKSFNIDGKEVLLPTVSDNGKILSDADAQEQYFKTGKHLGIFNNVENATKYAKQLSENQGEKLIAKDGQIPGQIYKRDDGTYYLVLKDKTLKTVTIENGKVKY